MTMRAVTAAPGVQPTASRLAAKVPEVPNVADDRIARANPNAPGPGPARRCCTSSPSTATFDTSCAPRRSGVAGTSYAWSRLTDMSELDQRVLDRVRKLLAKAEHPGTPAEEAQAFSAKASALMAAYAIDQALVEASQPSAATPIVREIEVDAPYAMPRAVLLDRVGRAHRVRTVRSEEHTSELQSHVNLVCRLLLEKKKEKSNNT